ncbi:MAG TPA: SRPBCC family protein [Solirubrobacter sp.]|jgi:uncharacterized protein YndB with AHSA1/START domain|nr:SRPBCC family protein [Solirubrobacter sp.]
MDSIEREIVIAAPVERVWEIVTEPEHMGRWFGDAGAERDGDTIKMRWEKYGEAELRIVRAEPPNVFAYRWDANVPGIGDTLVEFTLSAEGDGTRLRVVESGFASLGTSPAEQERLRGGNVEGWEHELGELERYAASVAV